MDERLRLLLPMFGTDYIESERAQSIAESRAEARAEQELAEEFTREDEMISSLIEVTGSRRFP